MGFRQKLMREVKEIILVALYFVIWLGVLVLIKELILADYQIRFHGMAKALIGSVVLAKVVLILEHVSLGSWERKLPAVVVAILRTAFYSLGVFIVVVLERGLEGRHEHGGFIPSLVAIFQGVDVYHVLVNVIVLSGALLVYSLVFVVRRHLGEGGLIRLYLSPIPAEPKGKQNESRS
jgi:hypothetical protein